MGLFKVPHIKSLSTLLLQVRFKALGRAFHFELEKASPKLTSNSIVLIRKVGFCLFLFVDKLMFRTIRDVHWL